jgi:hypothetical protein
MVIVVGYGVRIFPRLIRSDAHKSASAYLENNTASDELEFWARALTDESVSVALVPSPLAVDVATKLVMCRSKGSTPSISVTASNEILGVSARVRLLIVSVTVGDVTVPVVTGYKYPCSVRIIACNA